MNESRKEDRLPVALVMRYREPTMLEPREGQCQNLSSGGMCLLTPKPSPRGALLRFECISGGGAEAIRGTARVVWQRSKSGPRGQAGMGVRFVRLEPGGREALDSLLAQLGGSSAASSSSRPSDRTPAVTLVSAQTGGSGVTQQGMGAPRLRSVHYPTLRGVPAAAATAAVPTSSSPSSEQAASAAISPDPEAEVAGPRSTLPETNAAAHSPFQPTPSSPPPAVPSASETPPDGEPVAPNAGLRNGSGTLRERLDRTRRGMPAPAAPSSEDEAHSRSRHDLRFDRADGGSRGSEGRQRDPESDPPRDASRSSDRPPTSDRPPLERKSDRPPRPGGIDDLRAVPGTPVYPASNGANERTRSPSLGGTGDGRRSVGRRESFGSPPLLGDPDGRRRNSRLLPAAIIGSGLLFSWLAVRMFGSSPAGVPVEIDPKQAEQAPAPPADNPPSPPTTQPQVTPTVPPAAVAQAPDGTPLRYVLDVSSTPAGARVSALGKSIVTPATLELGELRAPVEVTAELDGYKSAKVPVAPGEFALRDDRYVRELVITLESSEAPAEPVPRARPGATAARTEAKPRPAVRRAPSRAAPPETPQIAQPPVPIGLSAAEAAPTGTAASAAPAPTAAAEETTPPPKEPSGPSQPNQLERALDCLARGDNACVINTLEGRARSERELVILIETHLAMGHSDDAERHMRSYLGSFPEGKSAAKYKRWLERREPPSTEPSPP